jgi:hypothetical protein
MAVLAWQVIVNIDENITFGRMEVMGNLYQRPVIAVLHDVQEKDELVAKLKALASG